MKRIIFSVSALLIFVFLLNACGSQSSQNIIPDELGIDLSGGMETEIRWCQKLGTAIKNGFSSIIGIKTSVTTKNVTIKQLTAM